MPAADPEKAPQKPVPPAREAEPAPEYDDVQESSEESFPASDPPGWTERDPKPAKPREKK